MVPINIFIAVDDVKKHHKSFNKMDKIGNDIV